MGFSEGSTVQNLQDWKNDQRPRRKPGLALVAGILLTTILVGGILWLVESFKAQPPADKSPVIRTRDNASVDSIMGSLSARYAVSELDDAAAKFVLSGTDFAGGPVVRTDQGLFVKYRLKSGEEMSDVLRRYQDQIRNADAYYYHARYDPDTVYLLSIRFLGDLPTPIRVRR